MLDEDGLPLDEVGPWAKEKRERLRKYVDLSGMHSATVGSEPGPRAWPMEEWWVEQLHEACERQDVAFFFKQWGGKRKKRAERSFKERTLDGYSVIPTAV